MTVIKQADLIQSIQREARQAVENMERSTRIVEEGLSLGNELGTALHKISNVVTEVYKFSQEIGAATNTQVELTSGVQAGDEVALDPPRL